MNNRIKLILMIVAVNFLLSTGTSFAFMSQAKITVKVVSESGQSVEKAEVGIGFETNSQPKELAVTGITDSEGRFSGSARCNGYIGFKVAKPGYYMSFGKYEFSYKNKGIIRWEPWNPEVTIVLRKIENPVSMYARDSRQSTLIIPVTGKDVGFDLIMYDWVKPFGNGKVADILCNLNVRRSARDDFEYNLKVSFPGQFNGIQSIEEDLLHGSEFKLPRFAPEDGYKKEVKAFIDRKPVGASKWSSKDNVHHIFRVRSELEKGKLKKAMYGKIIGDIDIGTKKEGTANLYFKYYLNPDYTRNLEFDPTRNLFLNLPSLEQVRIK